MSKRSKADARFKELLAEIYRLDAVRLNTPNQKERQDAITDLVPLRAEMRCLINDTTRARTRVGYFVGLLIIGVALASLVIFIITQIKELQ